VTGRDADERSVQRKVQTMSTASTLRRIDNDVTPILLSIRKRLAIHPHFRGRASLLSIELVAETIVLSGRLPSYYLKQLLAEAIREVPGVVNIEDHVDVLWPTVSSVGEGIAGRQKSSEDRSHTNGS
jgi:hypothetical protein